MQFVQNEHSQSASLLAHKDAATNGSIFKLHSEYQPTGDQPQAIGALVKGFQEGNQFQTLLGVTGSGKTFTMANIIQALKNLRLSLPITRPSLSNCTVSSRNIFRRMLCNI